MGSGMSSNSRPTPVSLLILRIREHLSSSIRSCVQQGLSHTVGILPIVDRIIKVRRMRRQHTGRRLTLLDVTLMLTMVVFAPLQAMCVLSSPSISQR